MEPWSLAVPDWRERIRTGRSLLPDLPHLNRAEADRSVAIFNKLRLPDVIGTPALAEAGADWFREIVGALHGSFDPIARERMIREIFLLAPKKSSKTSYAAALMVTTLLMNERPRAEFLLVAPTVSLAHIAFSQALGMVDKAQQVAAQAVACAGAPYSITSSARASSGAGTVRPSAFPSISMTSVSRFSAFATAAALSACSPRPGTKASWDGAYLLCLATPIEHLDSRS